MTESIEEFTKRQLDSPAGQVLRRLLTEPEFAAEVAENGREALADYDLTDELADALVSDAELLESETAGFAGLLTMGLLGLRADDPIINCSAPMDPSPAPPSGPRCSAPMDPSPPPPSGPKCTAKP